MKERNIYLDYAATTPTDPRVVKAMDKYWNIEFGNPSSLYSLGQKAKDSIDNSRKSISKILNCNPEEIIFTGGGTASINLGIKGLVNSLTNTKKHIITSSIEHHAVVHSVDKLNKQGSEVSILPVDKYGLVNIQDLKKSIQSNTVLISIMMANNEIGTIQPIQKIGAYLEKLNKTRKKKIYFHTDACQAAGALDLNVKKLHIDLLTLNGSKIYGPKGIGILYIKKGTQLTSLIDGGGQEKNLYSGTENVPAIIGLTKALELVEKNKEKENKRLIKLRDYLINKILKTIPKTRLNGDSKERLPNNINISIMDIEGEAILLYLDEIGIQASTGSACTSTSLEPSHVIRALGAPYEVAHGSMRFTLGKHTKKKDLEYLMNKLPNIVKTLRKISPTKSNMKEVEKEIDNFKRKIIKI